MISNDSSVFSQAITNIHYYPLGRITYESLWSWATEIVSMYNKKSQKATTNDHESKGTVESEATPVLDTEANPVISLDGQHTCTLQTHDEGTITQIVAQSLCDTSLAPPILTSSSDCTILTHSGQSTVCSLLPPQTVTDNTMATSESNLSSFTQRTDNINLLPIERNTQNNPNSLLDENKANDNTFAQLAEIHLPHSSTGISTSGTTNNEHAFAESLDRRTSHVEEYDISEDEEELIIVDDDVDSDSPKSFNESSAIEQLARDISATPTDQDPMSRFSTFNPDPLTEAVYGVAVCAVRFPAYFKPLYRLASTLNTLGYPLVSIQVICAVVVLLLFILLSGSQEISIGSNSKVFH